MTQQMYIGPNMPGIVKKGTVFIGELPERLSCAVKETPEIGNLIVPLVQATKAVGALRERGSMEEVSYTIAQQYTENRLRNQEEKKDVINI